jgi:Rieske Fe-S protein
MEAGDEMTDADAARGVTYSLAIRTVGRRMLLGTGLGLASRAAGAQTDAELERPQAGDLLVRVGSTESTPLRLDDLVVGAGQIFAWPLDPARNVVRSGSRLNKVLVLRLDPAAFDERTTQYAADGVVAYSAICPHTGCEVVNWSAELQLLECPCHNSQYDPRAGARVIGGPSPRSLATLPLRIDDGGKLAVARPFVGRLGIQQV